LRFYAVALTVIVLDQVSKLWIQATMPLGHSIPIIPDLFAIVHVLNPGAAFGLLATQAAAFRNPFFYRHRRADDHPLALLGLSLILGGAVGNLADRLRIGMVIDFIDVHYYQYHWPAFNVADSGITVGVSLMMLAMILEERRGRHQGPVS
jgi:signal peptidase II